MGQDRLRPAVGLLIAFQVALLSFDFDKIRLTSEGGVDLGRWLLIAPGQIFIGVFLLALSPHLWRTLRTGPALLAASWLVWNLTTVFWSIDPRQTFLQTLGAINLWLAAAWLVSRYGPLTFYRVSSRAIGANVVAGVLYQGIIGVEGNAGRLEGLSEGFTQLGTQCAFGLVLALAAHRAGSRSRADVGLIIFLFFALVGSGARGAVVATMIAGAIQLAPELRHRRSRFRAAAAAAVGAVLAGFALTQGIATFGRGDNATLNGREILWDHAWSLVQELPLRGHGMMTGLSLWTEAIVSGVVGFQAGSAHNMALEVLVGGGTIGLALFAGALALGLRNLFRAGQRNGIALVVVVLVIGLTESLVARPALTYWVLGGVMAMAAMGKESVVHLGTQSHRQPANIRRSSVSGGLSRGIPAATGLIVDLTPEIPAPRFARDVQVGPTVTQELIVVSRNGGAGTVPPETRGSDHESKSTVRLLGSEAGQGTDANEEHRLALLAASVAVWSPPSDVDPSSEFGEILMREPPQSPWTRTD